MNLLLNSMLELNNGIKIPILGLGTNDMYGSEAYKSVLWALEIGYRLIDTATFYENEKEIGKAIKDSNIAREEVFITTKVWKSDQGYNNTLSAFNKSLKKLKLTYVDLYLIHWPVSGLKEETWKALEKLYDDNKARAIGVSNYTIKHLREIFEYSNIKPAINQVEFSPFLYQKELLTYCKSKNIFLEAYCPLTRGRKFNSPVLKTLSQKYRKTPAQILIRWGLQHEIIEIPKSSNKKHLIENANVFDFEISNDDMMQFDSLNENFRIVEDPNLID